MTRLRHSRTFSARLRKLAGTTSHKKYESLPSNPDLLPAIVVLMLPWDKKTGNLETLCYSSAADKQSGT